jgi:surface antigen
VNRTVGLTLRRTAGGSIVFAIGFGALISPPIEVAPVSALTTLPRTNAIPAIEAVAYRSPRPSLSLSAPPTPVPVVSVVIAPRPTAKASIARTARVRTTRKVVTSAVASRPKAAALPGRVVGPFTGGANAFAYGYCTWWVAHKRNVPWRGNAAQWWWNARSFGAAEGATPRRGAIMVMGISGSSPQGHVGYVEAVNPNGSFLISEMNWWGVPGGGWGRVDYRTVTSMRGILGFIY